MNFRGRPPAMLVVSETAYNLAYVVLVVAVLAMLFPAFRWRLQRLAGELVYYLQMAQWRLRHPEPGWVGGLEGAKLADEPPRPS